MKLWGLWRVNTDWIFISVMLSIMIIAMCFHTRILQKHDIECENLLKTDKFILIIGKWLTISQIAIAVIGSFFSALIFEQIVENLIIASIMLTAIMLSNKILKN